MMLGLNTLSPNRLFEKLAEFRIARNKVLVERGYEFQRTLARFAVLKTVIGFGMVMVVVWLPYTIWSAIAAGVLGAMISTYGFSQFHTSFSYRSGWLDGRLKVVEGLGKCNSEWEMVNLVDAVCTYDVVHVLGGQAEVPDSPEGLA